MLKIIQELLTGKDGQTHDIARWSWMISLFAVIGFVIYEFVQGRATVSIREFAESVGIITGAHGAAVLMKKDTEPSPPPSDYVPPPPPPRDYPK
ncbi:hypothetical protein UFOVP58_54 [uncultured Caudovirales phage]|uniref:Uncharacterized protein n=1 Tax=uncultured Caudovirales phage TaxID=2100421 RepID=A0A6J5KUQ6_9CAUD|nr:hypothetical protein UFOVP58_54 [uncultured Caudovirales phage]